MKTRTFEIHLRYSQRNSFSFDQMYLKLADKAGMGEISLF